MHSGFFDIGEGIPSGKEVVNGGPARLEMRPAQELRAYLSALPEQEQAAALARLERVRPDVVDGAYRLPNGALQLPREVPPRPFAPKGRADGDASSRERTYYVNGINANAARVGYEAQLVSDTLGVPVVSIYNATGGMVRDLSEAAAQMIGGAATGSSSTVAAVVKQAVLTQRATHLIGYSQGAVVIAIGIKQAMDDLRATLGDDLESRMQCVRVTTLGGVGFSFPHGVAAKHIGNAMDPVMYLGPSGVGRTGSHGVAQRHGTFHRDREVDRVPAAAPHQLGGLPQLAVDKVHGLDTYLQRMRDQ